MSHFSIIKTRFVSAVHLLKALNDLGYADVEVYDSPRKLADLPLIRGSAEAEIIIRKKKANGLSADFGFLKDKHGKYNLVCGEADRLKLGVEWQSRLRRRYSYHVAVDTLAGQGFTLAEEVREADNSLRLVLRRVTASPAL